MGVNSINGQDLTILSPKTAAQAPAPQLRTAEAAPEVAPRKQASTTEPDEGQVQRAAGSNDTAQVIMTAVTRFRVDKASRRVIAQIVDKEGEVIRQIPPEEMLQIAAQFRKFQGMLFNEQT
jgi:flagellar protein FlaG